MTTAALITKTYNDTAVLTFREDGFFNMTFAAKVFGKEVHEFLRLPSTKEYISTLSSTGKIPALEIVPGNRYVASRGTWAHPKLAVVFARWLDIKFAVWCDAVIDDILRGHQTLQMVNKAESAVAALPADVQAAGAAWQDEMRKAVATLTATVERQQAEMAETRALLEDFMLKQEGAEKNAEYMSIDEYLSQAGLNFVHTSVKWKMRDVATAYCTRHGLPIGSTRHVYRGKPVTLPTYPKVVLNQALDEVYDVAAFDWLVKLTA